MMNTLSKGKTSGLYHITFYKKGNEFVKHSEYIKIFDECVKNEDIVGIKNLNRISHIGFKYNINDNYSAVCLFTSQPNTFLPGLNGKIENIKLNGSIYAYTNQPIIVENDTFDQYYTINVNTKYFPENIRYYGKEKMVEDAINSFKASYQFAIKNNKPVVFQLSMSKFEYVLPGDKLYVSYKNIFDNYFATMLRFGWAKESEKKTGISEKELENLEEIARKGFKGQEIEDFINSLQ